MALRTPEPASRSAMLAASTAAPPPLAGPAIERRRFDAARAARECAHVPYSHFKVGAALLDEQGRIRAGCNVENACYSPGVCAEAGALSALVLAGTRRLQAALVMGDGAHLCRGCAASVSRDGAAQHAGLMPTDSGSTLTPRPSGPQANKANKANRQGAGRIMTRRRRSRQIQSHPSSKRATKSTHSRESVETAVRSCIRMTGFRQLLARCSLQYSDASMMVRTRTVCLGSAGFSLPQVNVRS
jgi:homotetrameric cytidine deaminase